MLPTINCISFTTCQLCTEELLCVSDDQIPPSAIEEAESNHFICCIDDENIRQCAPNYDQKINSRVLVAPSSCLTLGFPMRASPRNSEGSLQDIRFFVKWRRITPFHHSSVDYRYLQSIIIFISLRPYFGITRNISWSTAVYYFPAVCLPRRNSQRSQINMCAS